MLRFLAVRIDDVRRLAGLRDHAQVQVKLVDLGIAVAQNLIRRFIGKLLCYEHYGRQKTTQINEEVNYNSIYYNETNLLLSLLLSV